MRIFIMGEVGVGKSHAINYLAGKTDKNYEVVQDPVIELGEDFLAGEDSLKIQLAVASQLYLTAATQDNKIFDSCLPQSFQFVRANYRLGHIEADDYHEINKTYNQMIQALGKGDVYIYLDKPENIVKKQIVKRGRPYEQDNPFIAESNELIRSSLVSYAKELGLKVIVVDVTESYDGLEKVIDELLEEC